MPDILAFIITASLFIFGIYVTKRKQEKFKAEMTDLAEKLNFNYLPDDDRNIVMKLKNFTHEELNNTIKASKILKGEISGVKIMVFEGRIGRGKHQNRFPCYMFFHEELVLPKMIIEPEGLLQKVFAKMDIDFDSHPEFSKKYVLWGDDEAEIRNVLNEEFLTLYEEFEFTQSMEIGEGVVVFFDFINFYKPKEIPEKLKAYVRLINLLMKGK